MKHLLSIINQLKLRRFDQGIPKNVWVMLTVLVQVNAIAQTFSLKPTEVYQPQRLVPIVITETVTGAVACVALDLLWYRKFPKSRFHFFNDNREWLQMDKVGHATTAYNLSVMQHDLMRWSGVRKLPAIGIGVLTGLGFMTLIEVMDGFSQHWGFSCGDMLANGSGAALFAAQQLGWDEQRLALKFSFHYSPFAKYNPKELGDNWRSRLLKDYNGQTYWLSFSPKSFLRATSAFPAFLKIAVGYGADGMTGALSNPDTVGGRQVPPFKRYRQFYLSPDVDTRVIRGNGVVNGATCIIQFLKFPAPAVEWNIRERLRWHWLYY